MWLHSCIGSEDECLDLKKDFTATLERIRTVRLLNVESEIDDMVTQIQENGNHLAFIVYPDGALEMINIFSAQLKFFSVEI